MLASLVRVMPEVFRHEGGYVDHPRDPGGATNMGITHRTLGAWRGRPVTKADVRNLSKEEATRIYRKQYWDKISGDDLPSGVDYAVFDFAINSGVRRASEYLQRASGMKGAEVDGVIGVRTLAQVAVCNPVNLINGICSDRLAFMKRIKNKRGVLLWPTFGKGWQRRVDDVLQLSLRLAADGHFDRMPPDVPGGGKPAPASGHGIINAIVRFILGLFGR